MNNLFLKMASYWRYFLNIPPKDNELGVPDYQLPIGHAYLIKEDWHLKRPWGEFHQEQGGRREGQENFWISEGAIDIQPTSINIYTWSNNKPSYPVDWICGMLWSKIEFGYGYSECEVILDDNMGQWSAPLWMFKEEGGTTREIDVCEVYVKKNKINLNSAMHFYGDRKSHIARHHPLRNPIGRPVRFGVLREPNWASIYYDGHLVRRNKIDTPRQMPALIGVGMRGGVSGSQGGLMKVLSFKHWRL